jgi:hypothetical protein
MGGDRPRTYIEGGSDRSVGITSRHHDGDLPLARAQKSRHLRGTDQPAAYPVHLAVENHRVGPPHSVAGRRPHPSGKVSDKQPDQRLHFGDVPFATPLCDCQQPIYHRAFSPAQDAQNGGAPRKPGTAFTSPPPGFPRITLRAPWPLVNPLIRTIGDIPRPSLDTQVLPCPSDRPRPAGPWILRGSRAYRRLPPHAREGLSPCHGASHDLDA